MLPGGCSLALTMGGTQQIFATVGVLAAAALPPTRRAGRSSLIMPDAPPPPMPSKIKRHRPAMSRPTQTARELEAMAAAAREGVPPATSSGDRDIAEAERRGDFARALALREEVKERAPDLDRLARAQAKRERRARRALP